MSDSDGKVFCTGIVDTYHGDGTFNIPAAVAAGLQAMFYKCSEGSDVLDSGYVQAMDRLKAEGVLHGTYHFARGTSDAIVQADRFSDDIRAFVDGHGDDILPVLDLEGDPRNPVTMSTSDAARFIERVHARLGRLPLLYMGLSKGRERMRRASPGELAVFRAVDLWLACYQHGDPTLIKSFGPWEKWTLLQYTDGDPNNSPRDDARFPHKTPGFARENQDRSIFMGSRGNMPSRSKSGVPWWVVPTLVSVGAGASVLLLSRRSFASTPRTPGSAPPASQSIPASFGSSTPHASRSDYMPTAVSGFAASLVGLSERDYLHAVEFALTSGRVPASQGTWHAVQTAYGTRRGVFFVQGMPLCCGTDESAFHAAMPVAVAQRIADRIGAALPTRKMVDLIHASATTRIGFQPFSRDRSAVSTFIASSASIEARRAGRGGLVSDFAKDYVVTAMRLAQPDRIAIYGGWESVSSAPVQPLAVPHSLGYYDYSQQARMVRADVTVDGRTMRLVDALADREVFHLFSDERIPADLQRYPTR
jgi:GH25 family lysozyme M1 (1,4-beta-N-acetylmuramidase)